MTINSSKVERFRLLTETVAHCRLCHRLRHRRKILGEANGNPETGVLFIAEAPGRLGADKTGVPLCGDQTGTTFQRMLDMIGWDRSQVFITNAVLCNPRSDEGNNARPSADEIRNCSAYLDILIGIIQPRFVITLGAVALKALHLLSPHKFLLKNDVRKAEEWNSRTLIPLYHPGPRARVHRDLSHQLSDFHALGEMIPRSALAPRKPRVHHEKQERLFEEIMAPTVLQQLAVYLVRKSRRLTKFKLAKLIYLIDYEFYTRQGRLLTEAFYIFQQQGPLQTTLTKRLTELEGFELERSIVGRHHVYLPGRKARFKPSLNAEEEQITNRILRKYRACDNKRIKTAVYMTTPVRNMLRLRKAGSDLLNRPVFR